MFPFNKMVKVKATIEQYYIDTCTISEYVKKRVNGVSEYTEEVTLADMPCYLSQNNTDSATPSDTASSINHRIELFLSPDIVIKAGSKIAVKRKESVTEYKSSGKPTIYPTHQQVVLELFDGWA